MNQEVDSPSIDHLSSGVTHDLAYSGPIGWSVAVLRAMLARRLGIKRAMGSFDEGMCQQLAASGAEARRPPEKICDGERFQLEIPACTVLVMPVAIQFHKAGQAAKIVAKDRIAP